jgi:hypothetical protein
MRRKIVIAQLLCGAASLTEPKLPFRHSSGASDRINSIMLPL